MARVPGPPASVLSAILVTNPNDPASPLRVATFSTSGQAPLLPSLANDVVVMPQDAELDANGTWTGFLSVLGLAGATAPARWVGATASGAPTSGTFSAGDFAVSADGNVYVCTAAGSPGTWIRSGSTPTTPVPIVNGGTGATTAAGAITNLGAMDLTSGQTVTGAKTFSVPPNLATQSVSSAATLVAASAPVVLTDTTSAAFTLTLPAAPVTGEFFIIIDDTGQWATHNLTVGRNGKNIDGSASNVTLATQFGKLWLYYDGTAWWTLAAGSGGGLTLDSTATDVQPDGTQAAGASTKAAPGNHVHPENAGWIPADNGYLGANGDYANTGGGGLTVAKTLYLQKLVIRAPTTITNLHFLCGTAGAGASTTSFVGLWNSSGTLLSGSSDVGSLFTSTGDISCPLTSAQPLAAGAVVYAGCVFNLATTQPTLERFLNISIASSANIATPATYRWATNGTNVTSLGALTLSSNAATAFTFWVGWT